jgi:GNAT superfamily N-acetyltransferase
MLESERLKIIPLNYDQLKKYTACDNSLENELGLKNSSRIIPEHLKNVIINKVLPAVKKDSGSFLYNTIWLATDIQKNVIVASFGFKGLPNDEKEIEIGYGTESEFQNKGYMTEAISCAVDWAKNRSDIYYIIAETDSDNIASVKVLEKNGFIQFKKTENNIRWRVNCK